MSRAERFGTRDLSYSHWHRQDEIVRFVGWKAATEMTYLDIDGCEYCCRCRAPLALIETAVDTPSATDKRTTVLVELAKRLKVSAWLVLYTKGSEEPVSDIEQFRVRRVWPEPQRLLMLISPQQWACQLVRLHEDHRCAQLVKSNGNGHHR